jgi:hypothetical protein
MNPRMLEIKLSGFLSNAQQKQKKQKERAA